MCEYCKMRIQAYAGDKVQVQIPILYCPVCGESIKKLDNNIWIPHVYIDQTEIKQAIAFSNMSEKAKETFNNLLDWTEKTITIMSPSKQARFHSLFHLDKENEEFK